MSKTTLPKEDILTAAKGGSITFVGKLVAYASQFILGLVVARRIGAEQFGLYNLGMTFAAIVTVAASLGLGRSLVRYIPISLRQGDVARLRGIMQVGIVIPGGISLICGAVVFLFAESIAVGLFQDPRLSSLLRLISVGIPLSALAVIAESITYGFKQMQYTVFARDIGFYLVKIPLTLVLLFVGMDVMSVVTAEIVARAFMTGVLFYFVNKLIPLNHPWHTAVREPKELLRFSLPIYLGNLISKTGNSFETLVLGFLGLTMGVGIYSAALRLSAVGSMFYLALNDISAPIISDLHSQGKSAQLQRFYHMVTKWAVLFNLPVFLTFLLFGEPLLSIFGDDFSNGATALLILALGPLIDAITGTCGVLINMTGHSKLAFFNSLFYLAITLIFDLLLIPRWEVLGAAWAYTLTIIIFNLVRVLQVYFIVRFFPFSISLVKPFGAALIATFAGFLLDQFLIFSSPVLELIVGLPIVWGSYVLVLVLLGISEEEQLVVHRLRSRFNIKQVFG